MHDALAEPVLTIEDVTERFNVTSKTIQRWRAQGLAGAAVRVPRRQAAGGVPAQQRRAVPSRHGDQVAAAANFSQVGDAEREEILRRARRLAEDVPLLRRRDHPPHRPAAATARR